MGYIADQVLKRTADKSLVRFGNIEAVSGGLASVRMGSAVVDSATWCRGYTPIVGDRVAVLASGSGWLILDAVEAVQRAYNEPETILVQPERYGSARNWLWSDSWDDHLLTPGVVDPKLPTPLTDGWSEIFSSPPYWLGGDGFALYEDVNYAYNPAGDGTVLNYVPSNGEKALFLWYPDLASSIPGTAILQSVSLVVRLFREGPETQLEDPFRPANPARVTVHAQSAPKAGTTTAGLPPEHYFVGDPIRAEGARPGDTVTIPLPDDWAAGLEDGSITGLALWDGGHGGLRTILTNDPVDGWTTDANKECLALRVSYITPVEEN